VRAALAETVSRQRHQSVAFECDFKSQRTFSVGGEEVSVTQRF